MRHFSIKGSKTAKFALGLTLIAALTACGGGSDGDSSVLRSSTNTSLTASSTNAATVAPAFVAAGTNAITFNTGFTGVDADGAPVTAPAGTTVAFSTGTTTSPTATFTSGGMTATGTTTFGSCLFTFASTSPFVAPHPFAPGKTFEVDPCSIKIPTANLLANGSTQNVSVELTFGTTVATSPVMTLTVDSTGGVTLNGIKVATVVVITGAGS